MAGGTGDAAQLAKGCAHTRTSGLAGWLAGDDMCRGESTAREQRRPSQGPSLYIHLPKHTQGRPPPCPSALPRGGRPAGAPCAVCCACTVLYCTVLCYAAPGWLLLVLYVLSLRARTHGACLYVCVCVCVVCGNDGRQQDRGQTNFLCRTDAAGRRRHCHCRRRRRHKKARHIPSRGINLGRVLLFALHHTKHRLEASASQRLLPIMVSAWALSIAAALRRRGLRCGSGAPALVCCWLSDDSVPLPCSVSSSATLIGL